MLRRWWNNLDRLDDPDFLATCEGKLMMCVMLAVTLPVLYVFAVVLLQLDVVVG